MDKDTILQLLSAVTEADIATLQGLDADTLLEDYGLTSIGFIKFIVSVEETFHIEILDSDLILSNFATISSLFATLSKYFDHFLPVKKVLVTDGDNTLWRGIAGEEDIVVDSNTLALQDTLIRLQQRGILLCLCSKNEPAHIDQAFRSPAMRLSETHFLLSKVNRLDKASNLRDMAAELNVTLDSFVFIDDSDYEIGLIRTTLPEVATVKVGDDMEAVCTAIDRCFADTPSSDVDRTRQYREQKQREQDKHRFTTVEEYNASLKTVITCAPAVPAQAVRIAELTQRTNQCNLSGRCYTTQEIGDAIESRNTVVLTLQAEDKYGDMGLVGAAITTSGDAPVIEGFFVSCRVFDRGFEEQLLEIVKSLFPDHPLYGVYRATDKNTRYCDFYKKHGVSEI